MPNWDGTTKGLTQFPHYLVSGGHLEQPARETFGYKSVAVGQALRPAGEMGEEGDHRQATVLPHDLAGRRVHLDNPRIAESPAVGTVVQQHVTVVQVGGMVLMRYVPRPHFQAISPVDRSTNATVSRTRKLIRKVLPSGGEVRSFAPPQALRLSRGQITSVSGSKWSADRQTFTSVLSDVTSTTWSLNICSGSLSVVKPPRNLRVSSADILPRCNRNRLLPLGSRLWRLKLGL